MRFNYVSVRLGFFPFSRCELRVCGASRPRESFRRTSRTRNPDPFGDFRPPPPLRKREETSPRAEDSAVSAVGAGSFPKTITHLVRLKINCRQTFVEARSAFGGPAATGLVRLCTDYSEAKNFDSFAASETAKLLLVLPVPVQISADDDDDEEETRFITCTARLEGSVRDFRESQIKIILTNKATVGSLGSGMRIDVIESASPLLCRQIFLIN